MHRTQRGSILIVLALVLFSSCSHIPDHARYIPKDAVAVAGFDLKALSKKIAWNVITGSKLFKEMQARIPEKNTKDAMGGVEQSGLDFANTFYLYVKTDNRFKGGNKVTGLVPLSDAGQWEAYIKKAIPGLAIKQHGDRKEASLGKGMYVAWNKNLLIIINVMPETAGQRPKNIESETRFAEKQGLDEAAVSAEMDNSFNITAENSVIGNKHFADLEKAGHDITFWLNYEQLMDQMSGSIAEKISMSLSGDMWKDAAFASGFDFEKGKITGDMHYYLSPDMKDIGTAFGATNADNDMVSRLPNQNLDMIAALHIAPAGIKAILDKMNLTAIANLALGAQGLSVDGILDAFTGDMAFAMNDFSLTTEMVTDTLMGSQVVLKNPKPTYRMCYTLKIHDKDNFHKLLKLVKEAGLPRMGTGFVIPMGDKDSVFIMVNDQYVIASNKYADATDFLEGKFKSQKMAENASSQITGHPWAFYFDIQQFCKNVDAGITRSARDSLMIVESKKLLKSISLNGGNYKNNAFEYHMDINFMNAEENSILDLMDYAMKMNDANKSGAL